VDVKNAYLNAELMEAIYMKQHPSFTLPGIKMQVCCLSRHCMASSKLGTAGTTNMQGVHKVHLHPICNRTQHVLQKQWILNSDHSSSCI